MNKNILSEVERIKQIMGLIVEQTQQTTQDESWKQVAGGLPYRLLYEDDAYFMDLNTQKFLENFGYEDIKVNYDTIFEFRIPVSSINPKDIELFKKNASPLIIGEFMYLDNQLKEKFERTYMYEKTIIQKNALFNSIIKRRFAGSFDLSGYDPRSTNLTNKIKSEGNSASYIGQTVPGLSLEVRTKFMEFIDKWVRENSKNKNNPYSNLKNLIKENGINLVKGRASEIETPEGEPTEELPINSLYSNLEVNGKEAPPFEDNSFALSQETISMIQSIREGILTNAPEGSGISARVVSKAVIDGTQQEIPFRISTSASRLRNTGDAKDKTFLQLSEERANSVYATMKELLDPLLVGGLPSPILDFNGTNGDGSSGPYPTSPNAVSPDGKYNSAITKNVDVERKKYGTPLPPYQLNEFKYCRINIVIEFFKEEETPGEEKTITPDTVFTKEWSYRIVRFRKKPKNPPPFRGGRPKKPSTPPKVRGGSNPCPSF